MSDYELRPDGSFIIKNYNEKKPFSNFLPGIAGLFGTPMWVFTVNRGQGVASFGTQNKDNAILEFFPANKAYREVSMQGFRTFIKVSKASAKGAHKPTFYEPFTQHQGLHHTFDQWMETTSHELVIHERNKSLGLDIRVRYFTIPNEPIACLARELTITNTSKDKFVIEVADGLPTLNPYGMNEFFVKNMSRTIEAWMTVEDTDKNMPYYRLKVDASDRPETILVEEGNFALFALQSSRTRSELMDTVVDPAVLFDHVLDFSRPKKFIDNTPFKMPKKQTTANQTPCAFGLMNVRLDPGKSKSMHSFFGHAKSRKDVQRFATQIQSGSYFDTKAEENRRVIESIKSKIFSVTASPAYDQYAGQTYLDNVMRGGLPVVMGKGDSRIVFHAYSRKHGDLERDYNRFSVDPTYLSQGNANFRDVNQNRRCDVWFGPEIGETNIKTFLNLTQLDGYNPLVLKGTTFKLKRTAESLRILKKYVGQKDFKECEGLMTRSFSPGDLCRVLDESGVIPKTRFLSFLTALGAWLGREENADHGEGYWVDHWTYNLDLVESYLGVYPERAKEIYLKDNDYIFYDTDHAVNPRSVKYRLQKNGAIRQFESVYKDKDKHALIQSRDSYPYYMRAKFGKGEIYRTTLLVKFLCIFINRFASMDAHGVGVEMEADKPGWYDSLNGLPGLLSSSLCETFELKRLAMHLLSFLDESAIDGNTTLDIPVELSDWIAKVDEKLVRFLPDSHKTQQKYFEFWDTNTTLKEKYRATTFYGVSGREKKLRMAEIKAFLEHAREKIELGIERAYDSKAKLYPTYFENELTKYKTAKSAAGDGITALEFQQKALPSFLEGPVHAMKVERDPSKRRDLLRGVRDSGLYDKKLNMYKVNAPLESLTLEVGRTRVFSPGWLENESIWLHMEYKFMLEVLRAGMADEYYKDFKNMLVPFQPADRYGRSILENSSFIVSSAYFKEDLHGTGFVARLSGSTAEFLSMWLLMNVGKKPFSLGPDGKVSLRFEPTLPDFLFTKEEVTRTYIDEQGGDVKVKIPKGCVAFRFLGKTIVVYHNPKKLDTFGKMRASVKKITLRNSQGKQMEFRGDTITSPYSLQVRDGLIPRIDIELG